MSMVAIGCARSGFVVCYKCCTENCVSLYLWYHTSMVLYHTIRYIHCVYGRYGMVPSWYQLRMYILLFCYHSVRLACNLSLSSLRQHRRLFTRWSKYCCTNRTIVTSILLSFSFEGKSKFIADWFIDRKYLYAITYMWSIYAPSRLPLLI